MVMIKLKLDEQQLTTLETAMALSGSKDVRSVLYSWIDSYKSKTIAGRKVMRPATSRAIADTRRRLIANGYTPSVSLIAAQVEDEDLGITATEEYVESVLKRLDSHTRYNEKRKPSKES